MSNYTQFIKDTFSVQLFNLGKKITPAPLVVLVTNIRFDTRYQHYDVSKFELALLWIKICTILSKRFMWWKFTFFIHRKCKLDFLHFSLGFVCYADSYLIEQYRPRKHVESAFTKYQSDIFSFYKYQT